MTRSPFPKITIVTPSFNQGEYLERTILSVINQHYPNLEYIIIDGGSTDNSLKIIKKYQKHLSYWQSRKDHGQHEAIQTGFDHSSGEIMGWLNSDDILFPNSLQLVGETFKKFDKIKWLVGRSIRINDTDEIVKIGAQTGKIRYLIRHGFYHGKGLGFIPQESTFWRRSLWNLSGKTIPPFYFSLDYRLWCQFARYSSLTTIDSALGAYRLNPQRKNNNPSDNRHYQEINPLLASLPRFTTIIRIFSLFLFSFCPKVTFNLKTNEWQHHSGIIK